MAEYRAYLIGDDGHFQSVRVLECPNDAKAIAQAKKLLDGADIELWQLERMVCRLDHKQE